MSHILTGKINHKLEEFYSLIVHSIPMACNNSYLLGNKALMIVLSIPNDRTGCVLEPVPGVVQALTGFTSKVGKPGNGTASQMLLWRAFIEISGERTDCPLAGWP